MTFCRLCFTDCSLQHEDLFNEDGSQSEVCLAMAKYFPESLEPLACARLDHHNDVKDRKMSRVICTGCWNHIRTFHSFQQTVLAAQAQYEKLQCAAEFGELFPLPNDDDHDEEEQSSAMQQPTNTELLKIEEVNVASDCYFLGQNITSELADCVDDANDDVPLSERLLLKMPPTSALNSPRKKSRGRPRKIKDQNPTATELDAHPLSAHPLNELKHVILPPTELSESEMPGCDPVEHADKISLLTPGREKRPRGRPKKTENNQICHSPTVKLETEEMAIDKQLVQSEAAAAATSQPTKKSRGRPKKQLPTEALVEVADNKLPDFHKEKEKKLEGPANKLTSSDNECGGDGDDDATAVSQSLTISKYDAFIAEHYKTELPCALCNFHARHFAALTAHFRDVHDTKRGYVICCDHKYNRRSSLVQHLQYHLNPEIFKCQQCGKCCASAVALDFHAKSRHPAVALERIFECEVCHKRFAKKAVLARHTLTHATGSKDHVCSICGKGYVQASLLKSHIRYVHSKADSRICELCGKSCRDKYVLQCHLREHDGVNRKWPCDKCGAELRNPSSLRRHKNIMHSDATVAYVCGDCGKVTSSENALRNHKRYMHVQQRTHKCTVCDKAFKVAKVLREHMTIHTGQHLYQCPYCPQTFRVSANMHHHRKRVHPKEWTADRKHSAAPPVDLKTVTSQIVL